MSTGKNVECKKHWLGQNIKKYSWLEIMLKVKNADMDKTRLIKKRWLEKMLNGENIDKGTKGRREKTQILFTRELE